MIFKDGYLNDLDTLHQLPLEVLEDSILRIYEDKYLSLDTKADLLGDIYTSGSIYWTDILLMLKRIYNEYPR